MKKVLLSLAILIAGVTFGQNVQDQKVSFGYVQLPLFPINEGITTYNVVNDVSAYTITNEDSMLVYQSKLSLLESQFDTWLIQKKKIDKVHLMNMATWEKKVNAGTSTSPTVMPVKQPYPKQPIKEELKLPLLTEDIPVNLMKTAIKLMGYDKGEGGVVVTITLLGFQEAKIIEKKTGTGATTKYTYTSTCKMPVRVTVEVPGDGIILNEVVNDIVQTELIKSYSSKYEHQVWLIDNYPIYWAARQKKVLAAALVIANKLINDKCGFPKMNRSSEIYTVKKHKGHAYSDIIDGYTKVKSGYDLLFKDADRKAAIAKITAGIAIWEGTLSESNPADSKSRVNKKVTALLYADLAEANMWANNYDAADNYLQKAKVAGVMKYKSFAKKLQPILNDLKIRYEVSR